MILNKSLSDTIYSWNKSLINSKFLSKNTVDSYLSDLKLFISFLNEYTDNPIDISYFCNLKKSDIRSWFLYKKNKLTNSKTLSRSLSSIKSFIKYLIEIKIIDNNSEILNMRPPKIEKNLPRPLSITQINDILKSIYDIKQKEWIIKRDIALLVLIYTVGLRINEALSINRVDIINNSSDFIVVLGKGSKYRYVPFISKAKETILEYLEICEFPNSEALFVNKFGNRLSYSAIQKLIKKSRDLLGLSDRVTVHALRHSCATHLLESGGDLRSIQELLGHSSISSTQIYSDIAKKHISDIYDKCHPLSNKNNKKSDSNSD